MRDRPRERDRVKDRGVTPETVGPFSRPVSTDNLPVRGTEVTVEATEEERRALALDFGLPEIRSLTGRYRLVGTARGVRATGRVEAAITQVCVVTLEPFDSIVEEDVEVDFASPSGDILPGAAESEEIDPPDPIVDGKVDLGSLTAEFLALGLDPYPRKPGVAFDYDEARDPKDSPFAALGKLKGEG